MSEAEVRQAVVWTLSGFGDEVDPDPVVQVAVLKALGASHIEIRSAWGTNVADLTDDRVHALRRTLAEAGMTVSAVASPIGKVAVDGDLASEVRRLERIVAVARTLGTRYIRVFSFFLEGRAHDAVRDRVLLGMTELARVAEREEMILLHENEKGIYGDTPHHVLDILESVGSRALRAAWDSANFVQVGVTRPHDEGYALLRPYLEYLQVKDARSVDGAVVPSGEGDGQVADTVAALAADGYTGYASLEPHLAQAHELGGFSGPTAYGAAARAFRSLAESAGVVLR